MSSTPTILMEKVTQTRSDSGEVHTFWIAYPREVAVYDEMPDRFLLAWGRGATPEMALEMAETR